MMDIVYLHNLRVDAVIGIFEWERRIKQTILIDIDMGTDISKAGRTDSIDDAVNYKAVSKRVISIAQNSQFSLVEALAEHVARTVLDEFGVVWVRIRINKQGALRDVKDVGVVIERGERGA